MANLKDLIGFAVCNDGPIEIGKTDRGRFEVKNRIWNKPVADGDTIEEAIENYVHALVRKFKQEMDGDQRSVLLCQGKVLAGLELLSQPTAPAAGKEAVE